MPIHHIQLILPSLTLLISKNIYTRTAANKYLWFNIYCIVLVNELKLKHSTGYVHTNICPKVVFSIVYFQNIIEEIIMHIGRIILYVMFKIRVIAVTPCF